MNNKNTTKLYTEILVSEKIMSYGKNFLENGNP